MLLVYIQYSVLKSMLSYFCIQVKNRQGNCFPSLYFHCCWACELQALKTLMRSFWERRTLKERAFEKCNPVLTAAVFCHIVTVLSHFSTSVSDSRCELDPKYQLCVHIEYLTFLTHFVEIFRLFAVGGRDGSSCLRSMECFDPHTNKWSMCAPMSKRRGGVGVATYNNFLYAVGGHDAPASNHCSRLSDCVER